MTSALPGFESPAVGFDQPFEMLLACHDRVRRSLARLTRLVAYLAEHPHDERSRSAARDVLSYFDLAAPLHHEDEERHVFPRLADAQPALQADVAVLRADHAQMQAEWTRLRALLLHWSQAEAGDPPDASARVLADSFASRYAGHLHVEETRVFPAARALIDEAGLQAMSQDMARRRGQGG